MSHRCFRRRTRQDRRGSVIGLLLVTLSALVALVAVTFNVSRLCYTREQMQAGCEAAALTGAASLMDENQLRGATPGFDGYLRARYATQSMADCNVADGRLVILDLNVANQPYGDIVVGNVPYPRQVGCPIQPWSAQQPANTVLVQARRSRLRGDPFFLWLGQMFGIPTGEVAACARATIDRSIYGFQPLAGTTAPLAPLAIDRQVWLSQTMAAAQAGVNDQYSVDYRTGQVTPGSDGIAEVQLCAALTGSTSQAGCDSDVLQLWLGSGGAGDESLRQQQLIRGLSAQDLANLGGQFSLAARSLTIAAQETFDPDWLATFQAATGKVRAWPLAVPAGTSAPGGTVSSDGTAESGSTTTPGSGQSSSQITSTVLGFGAGMVVGARIDNSSQTPWLIIVVQPAFLPTSTALVADGMAENYWIAKLMLTQ